MTLPTRVPLARPELPDWETLAPQLKTVITSGRLTNGPFVAELESRAADYLKVRHCIAVASCTAGLMLVLRASKIDGEVIVPGFTFSATAHAVAWNGLRPVFADCDPETLTLSVEAAETAIGEGASAILATHTFGTPCDVDALEALAKRRGLRLFFDSAHAFGSRSQDRPIGGFGDAEVFSLTPTKPVIAGEGGIIATNDDELAALCRMGRDYGNPGDYDCRFVGLNARMSELHAVLALNSLDSLEGRIAQRNRVAETYRRRLAGVAELSFPVIRAGDRSTFKDFTILVGSNGSHLRDRLAQHLSEVGIETRRYYSPPVHQQTAYAGNGFVQPSLPITEEISARVLTLPLWESMSDEIASSVAAQLDQALAVPMV